MNAPIPLPGGIRGKLAAAISLLIGAIAVLIYVIFPARLEHQTLQAFASRTRSIAEMTAFSVAPAMVFNDSAGLDAAAQAAIHNPDLEFLSIRDTSGRVVLWFDHAAAVSGRAVVAGPEARPADPADIQSVSLAIESNGQRVGTLSLGLSLRDVHEEVQAARRTAGWTSLALLLAGIAAAWLIGTLISRPLRAVVGVAHRIAAGDITQRADTAGSDEVAQLAVAFNGMVEGLARAQGALAEMNRNLESRVEHRTAELVAARDELIVSRDLAESANRAKSEFLANMSHEIRTPMNGVLGILDLALDAESDPGKREFLGMAKSSADSLLGVLNDILDFSKIEAGKLSLDPVDFSLTACLEETMSGLAPRAQKKGLELLWQVDPEVPHDLTGDPGRIRQVLVNLVGNAIKFTAAGEIHLQVESDRSDPEGMQLHVAVRDTGIGIPADKQEHIFSAFAQADGSTTRTYGGTGLGLTISAQLVALMGGRIWVESEPGLGSTFHFTFRVAAASTPVAKVEARSMAEMVGLPVLVVDDNDTNRRILTELLRRWQMSPSAAASGPEAMEQLLQGQAEGRPFPLVLLDGHMPEMDGFAVAERIRQEPRLAGAVIMMLSSGAFPDDAGRCRALGIDVYVAKPVRPSNLLDAIANILGPGGATPVRVPANATPSAQADGPGLRVLVAEDNRVNQMVVRRYLERMGHGVTMVENGRLAVELTARERFDAVLMDVQMPEMGGFEATAAIREREQATGGHLPIVGLTAHAMQGDRERCLESGMDDYLTKPIDGPALSAILQRVTAPPRFPPD